MSKTAEVTKKVNLYHASNLSGLTELKPFSTMHGSGEKVCYFTPVRACALLYLRDMDINHVTCALSDDGIAIYHEQFPNQLETLYKGRKGSIYVCDGDGISQGHTNGVWVSHFPVAVGAEQLVLDVYAEILKAEKAGELQVVRYETLSDQNKNDITQMMNRYITKNGLLHSTGAKAQFMRTYFSRSWELALSEKL